ncbi:MAG: right-handed parallel beta-helix repeat-containing protein [bacterium]|nr:right-handed parallel beta-helix repeat-containing protein [bacterium]
MAALLLAASPLTAATWRVELNGSGDFTDIQPAVDAAAAGDTIRIGPGRFATFHPIGLPGYFDEVIVLIRKPNLTFIGAGKNVTRIGPTSAYVPYAKAPRAFFSLSPNNFKLRDLTVENVCLLVFASNYVDIEGCTFNAPDHRIICISIYDSAARVESCEFTLYGALGVLFNGPSSGAVINACQFLGTGNSNPVNCSFGPRNVSVSGCNVTNGGFVFYDATGSVANCTFVNGIAKALHVDMPTSNILLNSVTIEGGAEVGLSILGSGRVTAEGLVIAGTTTAAITTSARSYLSVRNSSILPASGWAVYANVSSGWPTHTLDLTNNNWGVTDAAAIDAMIWDHHDDPNNPCTVIYQPYVGQPVSIESTTWGGLKSLWR